MKGEGVKVAGTKRVANQGTINIKSVPMQLHIGASKYVNDDWGTLVFIIPRNQLQTRFTDLELRYNCIYFLFGYGDADELVYVGQAKKRNNGESVLARLREHDTNIAEKYYDIWQWAVVCTGKEDAWTLDDLNALEHAFYKEIPSEQSLNGNNPNSGGTNYEAYTDKIKQIKSYITSIGFNIFADSEYTENIQVTSEVSEGTTVEDLQNGLARIPEIVTPHKLVKAMCDMLPPEVWNDKTVFLDPACKGGEYLREIYDRLMDSEIMQAKYPDEFERSNHILGKQLYGIALSQVSLERATKKLRGYDHNLRVIPNYIRKLRGIGLGRHLDGTPKTIQDIINEEFNKDMRVDVVISNPPYQEITGGGLNDSGGKPLFDVFILNGIIISNRILCMITPTKWISGNQSNYVELRKSLLQGRHIKEMVDFFNPTHAFPGTQIAGGVSYFLYDKQYTGNVRFTHSIKTDTEILSTNDRCFNTDAIIPRHAVGEYVINKISQASDNIGYLNNYVYKNLWRLPTNFSDASVVRTSPIELEVITPNQIYYIDRGTVENVSIDCYKVIFTRVVNGSTFLRDSKKAILSSIRVIGPGEICNASYMLVGNINKKEYAENIKKYLQTKFTRFLVLQTLFGIGLTSDRFQFVPLQDFANNSNIDWSQPISDIDQQLYRKYGLTEEEMNYIEKIMKPMN